MPIPASGPISMSMLNVELGRSSNTANSQLAGGSTPTVGSLFWLGAQSGSLNQTAPHAISEWYGYSAATVPTPFLQYDPYLSAFNGVTAVNLGTGGSTYNLTVSGSIVTGSSGTGAYYSINETASGQYLGSVTGPNLSGSSFSVSMMIYPIKSDILPSSYVAITSQSFSVVNGYQLVPQTSTSTNLFNYVWDNSISDLSIFGSVTLSTWNHIVFTLDYSSKTGSLYINNSLIGVDSTTADRLPAVTSYEIGIGFEPTNNGFYTSSLRLGNLSFWTSSLNSAQVGVLYSEFDARY
jgi:hypothetical protein